MVKVKKTILSIISGLALTFFFYFYLFQHPIYISLRTFFYSIIAGFGTSLILDFSARKIKVKEEGIGKICIKRSAVGSLIGMILVLLLFKVPTNLLLAPRVKLSISLPAGSGFTSLRIKSIHSGIQDINLREDILLEQNAFRTNDGILLIPKPGEESRVGWEGRAWNRLYITFTDSRGGGNVVLSVNGRNEVFNITEGQSQNEANMPLKVPNASILPLVSFISISACIFLSLFSLSILMEFIFQKNKGGLDFINKLCIGMIIVLYVLIAIYPQGPQYRYPGIDSVTYMYISRGLLNGEIPYRDNWDNKGPFLYLIDAVGLAFGIEEWGVWVIEVIFLIASCVLMVKLLKQRAGYLVLTILLLFYTRSFTYRLEGGNFTEEYAAFFYLLNIYLFWKYVGDAQERSSQRYLFFMGVVTAFCILLRPNLISSSVAIVLMILVQGILGKNFQSALKNLCILFIGFLVIFGLFCGFFIAHGSLHDFLDAVFYYNFFYTDTPKQNALENLAQAFKLYPLELHAASISALVIIIYLILRRKKVKPGYFSLVGVIISGFLVELFLFNLSGRGYFHYYLGLFPYIFLLIGFGAGLIRAYIMSNAKWAEYKVVLPPFFLLIAAIGINNCFAEITYYPDKSNPTYAEAGKIVGENRYLEVWGHGVDYLYWLNKDSTSRFIYHHPLYVCDYVTDEMVGELLEGIKEHQPIVIDSRFNNSTHSLNERIRKPGKDCEALDVFYDYFSKNYHAYTALSNGFVVYQPNG